MVFIDLESCRCDVMKIGVFIREVSFMRDSNVGIYIYNVKYRQSTPTCVTTPLPSEFLRQKCGDRQHALSGGATIPPPHRFYCSSTDHEEGGEL